MAFEENCNVQILCYCSPYCSIVLQIVMLRSSGNQSLKTKKAVDGSVLADQSLGDQYNVIV